MNLSQIIEANKKADSSILIETILSYKKSLYTYFKDEFCCEHVLMVTDVFNAAQYGKIVSSNEFEEAITEYVNTIPDMTEQEKEEQKELINSQSCMFNKL